MKIKDLYDLYTLHFLVDTDTRKIRKNTLFFGLKGTHFNGNEFAEKALEMGASYAIVDQEKYVTHQHIILVKNVLKTLQDLANYHRNILKIPIIGITGSNGKTTTKELLYATLSKKYSTTATKGNLNNHIGVPLTLLSMTPKTEIGIVEMGANHQKEIEFLCSICEPDFGYITNFGKAHIEGFGGLEGVIKGKSELYSFLEKNNKTAFINPKDMLQVEKTKNATSISFPSHLKFLGASPYVKISFDGTQIESHLIGNYNYTNIAIAATIANYFKVSTVEIKNAIEHYIPENNRSQIIKKQSNHIILDAYNANPSSMKVAIENFKLMDQHKKTVILGDMFELGASSLVEHQIIIDLVEKLNFENAYFVGENFYQTKANSQLFKTFEELFVTLKTNPLESQSILIKGSRGMQLERLLAIID